MGYIFEKLKISAKTLTMRFYAHFRSLVILTCSEPLILDGIHVCLTPKMALFSPLFHIFMNDNKSTWSPELGDEKTARNSDVES